MQLSSESGTQTGEAAGPKREGEVLPEDMGGNGSSPARTSIRQPSPAREVSGEVGYENGDDGHKLEAKDLTPRQSEVLNLYQREKRASKVGRILGISTDSVSGHLVVIRDKLGLSDIRQLWEGCELSLKSNVTAAKLLAMLEEQDYRCALSGRKLEPDTATLDHKVPRSVGGDHSMGNVWFLHRDVNRAKGTHTVEEFLHMCQQVRQYSENRPG